ncbi:myoneurin-like isoform X1 [Schistocerca cancellata]|uniref:myoneurin-like isoform X1 n=1 Tax=Schistocerca cancellata TaxID=274614 RepID=UPI0021179461|nr:myoneurin-like isoform X1 [Schistocerca cancellata]XP_049769651.1 myoneurin-like isoform X1 [Schistocerca cancellata]XP_049769652.1 myoneurin-like isoform X1 [Schistocerca cancellata]XP_049769653.1 myoneurin-like isoform X1 [Schistocerca cancellata]XP_049769654.1 myoneurin-like isoform X1 [Schistocerca cancellata]XP_049769655.1 myoneurin-like isoform X1 [Schistocerca cancellata]XP_049769656.1 myoneurin-like isoform X1 [Schistocerca cancellata]XP_049769657.1 myoneurin-like isoform X1 [Schi
MSSPRVPVKEEPLDTLTAVDTDPVRIKIEPEHDQCAATHPDSEATKIKVFHLEGVKREWIEDNVKKCGWDGAQVCEKTAPETDGVKLHVFEKAAAGKDVVHAKRGPCKLCISEDPVCIKIEPEHDQCAATLPVPEATKIKPFDLEALKQEWSEDDVEEDFWDVAQVPEKAAVERDGVMLQVCEKAAVEKDGVRAETPKTAQSSEQCVQEGLESANTTVDTVRLIVQDQDRPPPIDKCTSVRTRIDGTAGTRGIGGGQQVRERNKRNTRVLLVKVVFAQKRGRVDTPEETRPAPSAAVSDRRRGEASDTCRGRHPVDSGREVPSRSERDAVPPAGRETYTCTDEEVPSTPPTPTRRHRWTCETCHAPCRSFHELRVHCWKHQGKQIYGCDHCTRKFARRNSLKRHSLQHMLLWPYECGVCYRRFVNNTHLAHHSLAHEGSRPYQCDSCGRTFSRSRDCKMHYRACVGERIYCCDVCGKKFASESGLRHHGRLHSLRQC